MALRGGVPERPKGAGCKPVGSAYGGSNPPSPTRLLGRRLRRPGATGLWSRLTPLSARSSARPCGEHCPLRARTLSRAPSKREQFFPVWLPGRRLRRPGATGLWSRLTPLSARSSTRPCGEHCPLRARTLSRAPSKREQFFPVWLPGRRLRRPGATGLWSRLTPLSARSSSRVGNTVLSGLARSAA